MSHLKSFMQDFSASALVTGLIAVIVSYAGPLVIVFQAAQGGHLTPAQLSSWIWAISIGSGITGMYLSIRYRAPVITAWSTPGAALLVTSLAQYSYAEAVGAYLFSALLITLLGVTGLFSRIMERLPVGVIAAMLAGILFRFGIGVFSSLEQLPALVLPMVVVYLIGRRWWPRYAIVATLAVAFAVASGLGKLNFEHFSASLAIPVWTSPQLSLPAIIGLGIPLCFVTMASQNAPGIAVLRTFGYATPINPLITTTGLVSLLLAPFGAHGINLAAITAAICTGEEAHPQAGRRYIAGVSCAAFYLLIGSFGATIAGLFSSLPSALIASLAGLALFSSLANGLGLALSNERKREPALITFLVTASGVSFFGIGAAFWGLALGVAADWLLFGELPWRRVVPATR
ncbi:MAG: benzoate/H(+) symporter BenE family transporter [Betaproteobacteria bacterium]|nr:benzoate/H(+) symporter BenE family transporter [Betaproteobacteria bacterium]